MTLRRLRRLRPKEEDAAAAPERPGPADVYRALAAAGGTLPRVRKVGLAAPPGAGRAGEPPRCPRFVPRGRCGPGAAISNGPGGGQWGSEVASSCAAPMPAPCGAAPAASPGSCSSDPPDLCPVSPSCPGDTPSPAPASPHPGPIFHRHLPRVPVPHQCCPPERHVLSQFLPTSRTGPHPSVRGHVTRTTMSPPMGSAPQGRQDRRSLGVRLHGTWEIRHRAPGKAPFWWRWGCHRPAAPPGPAALPERRGEARTEPTSGAEVAFVAVLARPGSRAVAWIPLTSKATTGDVPEGAGVSHVTSPSLGRRGGPT